MKVSYKAKRNDSPWTDSCVYIQLCESFGVYDRPEAFQSVFFSSSYCSTLVCCSFHLCVEDVNMLEKASFLVEGFKNRVFLCDLFVRKYCK